MSEGAAIGFWRTVRLLLRATRLRSEGRRDRQRQLMNNRAGEERTDWSGLGVVISVIVMAGLHGASAFAVMAAVDAGQRLEATHHGKIVVRQFFIDQVNSAQETMNLSADGEYEEYVVEPDYQQAAEDIAERAGGNEAAIEKQLRETVAASGSRGLTARAEAEPGLPALGKSAAASTILGSFMLLWWLAMLICQGEGLEMDLQRRRHPMWEWLLSHPVDAGAVFLAEMLAPLSANPTYWTAPLFVGILYGSAIDPLAGVAAGVLIGVPLAVAAGCVGKALEIGAILRLPMRSRGAVIGILSWFGYASLFLMFVGVAILPKVFAIVAQWIDASGMPAWGLLGLFLGMGRDGSFSLLRGLLFGWAVSGPLIAGAVIFIGRSVRNGLAGAFPADSIQRRSGRKANFGRAPLFRKELLWFVRDRSATVQVILIPVTIGAFQLFHFRFLLEHAGDSWNYLTGTAILFGTYLLWVLGPKSLVSEGSALWIALTWPRGLESVLKAKAWLWSMIATGLVSLILLATCWVFPQDTWKIVLAGIGWAFFSRTMAEKAVTLVTVVSESGEAEKIPAGRRWAAQLGMLTFAIGVCTQQWNLAIFGIVYSWITAAAMWENLRARLPYLYDPWSERLPEPPTLMHAMISISILLECVSVLSVVLYAAGGHNAGVVQGFAYALCAVGVSVGVAMFLDMRGVSPVRVWCWRDDEPDPDLKEAWFRRYIADNLGELHWLVIGLAGGVALALVAQLYLMGIMLIPSAAEIIRASEAEALNTPGLNTAFAIAAIGFAPFAEEFLFRGMVFRALDRQWGEWRAVAASAAFFAIYHPAISWVPVAALGAVNCVLFKRSKRLAPAVLLHMSYNAVVFLLG